MHMTSSFPATVPLWTALVTPFNEEDGIDMPAFERLVSSQVSAGVQGLLMFGSTGEASTLSEEEKVRLLSALEPLKGEASVMVGITHNDTRVACERARAAADWGADVLLVAPPYYNKPSQAGIVAHFKALHEASPLPIMLYNIPSRVGVSMDINTLRELAKLPGIMGLKEAAADLPMSARLVSAMPVWCGDDPLILPYMSVGALGAISVVSNLFPRHFLALIEAQLAGRHDEARKLNLELAEVFPLLFAESNPMGIKAAMAHRGLIKNHLRLPLVSMSEQNTTRLFRALDSLRIS